MFQALIKRGKVFCEEVPSPLVSRGSLLVKVVNSCISAGTELSSVIDTEQSLIKKALKQPEKIEKILNIVKSEGIISTLERIKGKLEAGKPTGYSLSGIVIGIGEGVSGFNVGDFVAAAGAGIANHAEYVDVPVNLVVKMPKNLSFEKASTVALGAIALHSVRRIDLNIGEYCVVFGAGIIGMISLQILRSAGIRVAVCDIDDRRLEIAKQLGAEIILNPNKDDVVNIVYNWTGGYGADGVLFTAATQSSEPLSQSFKMCRKKGRVVLVGTSGMEIKREDIYKKEIDFMISTSYGPGRYDDNYEQKGLDYPYAYIRWTENRNMAEYLRLVSVGVIDLDKIIEKIYPIEKVTEAFECLKSDRKPLIVLLEYGKPEINKFSEYLTTKKTLFLNSDNTRIKNDLINVAIVGAGGFATGVHLPNIKKLRDKFRLKAVVSRKGYDAKNVALQFGAEYSTTDYEEVLKDKDIDLVIICTRHDSHAELVLKALKAGKNVFVEKPLATKQEDLDKIKEFYENNENLNPPLLFVGFNRRFSPYLQEIKKHVIKRINPMYIIYRMNAGYISLDHWIHQEGGRIIGEVCHIIDLATFLTEDIIENISVESLTPSTDYYSKEDNKSIILKYKDGSVINIHYFATGSKDLSKEYMEVHFDGKSIILDDYKILKGFGIKINEIKTPTPQKGHFEELEIIYETLKGKRKEWPIELWDMFQTTEATFKIKEII